VWWLNGVVWWLKGVVWWLNGSAPDCCPVVPGSNQASTQPTADCQSPSWWVATWDGTCLRADLYEWRQRRKLRKYQKTIQRKKKIFHRNHLKKITVFLEYQAVLIFPFLDPLSSLRRILFSLAHNLNIYK
jgi:hypothetical protein